MSVGYNNLLRVSVFQRKQHGYRYRLLQQSPILDPDWLFGKEYAGVDPETGEAMWYKGQEGDEKTKNVNEAGQRIVGSADPKFYGGFGMNFKYKGFDFSFDTSFT